MNNNEISESKKESCCGKHQGGCGCGESCACKSKKGKSQVEGGADGK